MYVNLVDCQVRLFTFFNMDNTAYISFSLALRLIASAMDDIRVGSAIVGLFEGTVLHHTLKKPGRSSLSQFTPYARVSFCLLADFAFTKCWNRLLLVMLTTGLGALLSDVGHIMLEPSHVQCDRCQTKRKTSIYTNLPRRGLVSNKTKFTSYARFTLTSDVRMSMPAPGARMLRAASPPDSIDDDLEHLHNLPRIPIKEAARTSSPSSHLSHSITTTPTIEPQMPNSALLPNSNFENIDSPLHTPTVQTPDVILPVPYMSDLRYLSSSGNGYLPDTSITPPLSEDAPGWIKQNSGQQTPIATHQGFKFRSPTPDAVPPVVCTSNEPKNDPVAVTLAASSAHPDDLDDFESEASPPMSVLSVTGREELISHAGMIRQAAVEADQLCIRLKTQRHQAMAEGRIKDAFLLKQRIEDEQIISRKLHERAERRYYCGV